MRSARLYFLLFENSCDALGLMRADNALVPPAGCLTMHIEVNRLLHALISSELCEARRRVIQLYTPADCVC